MGPTDAFDGYSPTQARLDAASDPAINGALSAAMAAGDTLLAGPDLADFTRRLDGFVNANTGLGDPAVDRQMGGLTGGPSFTLYKMNAAECEARYRGSDIGRNAVDKYPDEMTRRGWDVQVQPTDDDEEIASDPAAKLDACRRDPRRAAAGWRTAARTGRMDERQRAACRERARRWDAVAAGAVPPEAAPPPPPGALPAIDDEGATIGEATAKLDAKLGLVRAVNLALKYERAFGGGCVFIGVDDGGRPLHEPLDPARVRRVTHLTPLRGGFDGPVIMWRPYRFAISRDYGRPEIFQVRNLTVPIAAVPAPGEMLPASANQYPPSPAGPTQFYVHESRFLIFDGDPATTESQQENRGWGDSVFTRAGAALAQFEQAWQAVGNLIQVASIDVQSIPGFSKALAEKGAAARAVFLQYAQLQSLILSVARTKYIDKDETYDRKAVSFGGLSELLGQSADRLAAAFDMPVSVLFGNLKGGLGAREDPSMRSFYDRVQGKQENHLGAQLERYYRILFRSQQGPTKGREPERWGVYFRSLWQLTELEQADLRSKTSAADVAEISAQIVTPEEVAATRYGGSDYNTGPIVLDMDTRRPRAAVASGASRVTPGSGPPQPHAGPTSGSPTNGSPTPNTTPPTPPIRMMPTDPWTGEPSSVASAGPAVQREPQQGPVRVVASGAERGDDAREDYAGQPRDPRGRFASSSGGGASGAPAGASRPSQASSTAPTAPQAPPRVHAPSVPTATAMAFENTPHGEAQAEKFAQEKFGSWATNLKPAQEHAIDVYRSKAFQDINKEMREGKPSAKTRQVIAKLESTMTTTPEPFVVHRGMNIDPSKLAIGSVIQDKAPISTTLAPRIAHGFRRGGAMMEITVKPGARFAPIASMKNQGILKEHEMLLAPGTSLRVVGHEIRKMKMRHGYEKVHFFKLETA